VGAGKAVSGPFNGDRVIKLAKTDHGYHLGVAEGIPAGTRYVYSLDGKIHRPDPASLFQPEGVHGPSEVFDLGSFNWQDAGWAGLPLEDYILYEVHVGAYSSDGTFEGIIPHLDELKELGVTALELMPVAQFPGERNWGYDGVYPFAAQQSYGGPVGLQKLVEACHARQMAVTLDVVYNHLGPEGNYLGDFGPYFTDRYRTPWGQALNFDGPSSDEVVRFFIENALYWLRDFHIDALRLDAIHGIIDCSAQPFLQLLAREVHKFAESAGRKIYLMAESDMNDRRHTQVAESGGYGLDAQWDDDFHHALHTLLTGEKAGYYQDFGRLEHLQKALGEGFVFTGQYSTYRQRRHGSPSRDISPRRFVVFSQNHDQIGNRMLGDRLSSARGFERLRLGAGMVILSPYLPLLFMGEEWGETGPFLYFTSHTDTGLVEAVRRGRREEFAAFGWQREPPDPQASATYSKTKLDHNLKRMDPHCTLREFYKELIRVRRTLPALSAPAIRQMEMRGDEAERTLCIRRWVENDDVLIMANFSDEVRLVTAPAPAGEWCKILDSADRRWGGAGSSVPIRFQSSKEVRVELCPNSFSLFQRQK